MFVDTTFCIDLLRESVRGNVGPATSKLDSFGNRTLYASVFVLCELHAGARMAPQPRRELRRIELLSENLAAVYPDATFAVAYGELESYLRMQGIPIPTMDLLIGATAKIHGLPLITRDSEHYARIPGLVIESY
jgi:tRNA(fMet)-specific endonuclease VapC